MDSSLIAATNALPLVALAIFLAAAFLSLMLGCILSYHWFRFAMNPAVSMMSLIVYFSVTLLLLSGLLLATLSLNAVI
jgi:hypothetical protein